MLAAIPVVLWVGPLADTLRGWEWTWPVMLLVGLVSKAARNRAHETESDRRAVELGCDAEALVSALVKTHNLLRLARRWGAAQENLSSHPSLARRIRDIREAAARDEAGAERDEDFEPLLVRAEGSDGAVLFDASKVHRLRGLPEDGRDLLARAEERLSIPYARLRELHVEGSFDKRLLVLTDSTGRTTRMPVAAENVPALQTLLDRVDTRLSFPSPEAKVATGRIWSLLLLLLGLLPPFSWVVTLLGALALARPAEATLAALGAAGLATALWNVLRPAASAASSP